MAAIVWDKIGERIFETGVGKGVLYPENAPGVAWNGLISVEDTPSDEVEPVFFDGLKINNVLTPGDFTATLKAYTYPDEFLPYEGVAEFRDGVYVTHQPRGLFGLSFRTRIGNDIDGPDHGYKLHLLYNLTAVPSARAFETLSLDVNPIEFEWTISAIPEDLDFYRPTAHMILDSTETDPYLMADIESILYGTATDEPRLPSMKSLGAHIAHWGRFVITDHGDGTWTAYSPLPDVIVMTDSTTFEITTDTATYLDAETYTISSAARGDIDP
jgi:hypothetical protein